MIMIVIIINIIIWIPTRGGQLTFSCDKMQVFRMCVYETEMRYTTVINYYTL